jgi:hypothetical protein
MTLIQFNESQDIISTKLDTANTQFTVSSSAQANANNLWVFMANSSTGGYLAKPDGSSLSTSNISTSAAFRQLATFFFGTGSYILDSFDGTTQRTTVRVIQLGRPALDEGFWPNSITATVTGVNAGVNPFTLTAHDVVNVSSVNSPLGLTGAMININDATDQVGTVFYDHGVIVFHGGRSATSNLLAVSTTGSFATNSYSNSFINLVGFAAQSRNIVKRTVYFTRAFNRDFNYTTNPTARTSDGYIINSLTANPTTFVTTVGLYDDSGNLLAVGKVNPPKQKDAYSEILFKVQLDF